MNGNVAYKNKIMALLFGLSLLFFVFPAVEVKAEGKAWSVALLGGVMSGDTLGEVVLLDAEYDYSHTFVSLALNRRLGNWKRHVDIEVEGQVARHMGAQKYWEYDAALIARWLTFPWDHHIDTSFAVGEGFSVMSETSEIESRRDGRTSKFLNYLLFELAFAPPEDPDWSLITRIHHRSGIRGAINDVFGASNAFVVGIRHAF